MLYEVITLPHPLAGVATTGWANVYVSGKLACESCFAAVSGLNESSIVWNSVFPGSPGDFNSYLDCTTACDTIHITPQTGYPPYIDISYNFV